ncbi:MAG: hypothetical protein A2Y73_05095 [Chloroflexi bacterium RBG_13_56_8]|nr:MAG: hypothetical protein A2Y73_05095 [Chloroflexi bacterium RBG_13_56_8]
MQTNDPGWTSSHENDHGEPQWAHLDESLLERVKFEVHLHYLRKYLTGSERVLEIGAGQGRFTGELAKLCRRIVVADISLTKLQLNRRNAQALGYTDSVEEWVESDVSDLEPHFREGEFDAVVCYGGPLSYVFDRREKALAELVRVTRPGGTLFLSVMSLWGTIHQNFPSILENDPRINQEIVRSGNLGPDKVAVSTHFLHAYRSTEFRAFIENAGAYVMELSASDCLSSTWEDLLSTWCDNERIWHHLVDLEIEACRQPGCLDMGTHLIAVARRPS